MTQMFLQLPGLNASILDFLTLVALCSTRMMVVMNMFPPTGDTVMQGTTRNATVMLLSTFIAYGQAPLIPQLHGSFLVVTAAKEAVIGLVIGYAASQIFWAAESIGAYIDDVAGYNNVQMTNPTNGQQTSITSTLLSNCAMTAFWMLGGMTFLLGAIYESYHWWPLASATPLPSNILETFTMHATDSLMVSIAKVAAPITAILVLVDVGFGFISKSAQKLDFGTLSHAVKGLLAVLLLALLVGVFIDQVHGQLALTDIGAQMRVLSGER
jgi:type III secretion protein T